MSYGWRSWRDAFREALIAGLIGMVFTALSGRVLADTPELYLRDAFTFICVLFCTRGLETALSWAIEQSRYPLLFRCLIYLLGSWIGFLVAASVVAERWGPPALSISVDSITAVLLLGGTFAFILHHNRKRTDRIAASVARLKEHEFAEKELEIARAMQQRLLPPPLVERGGLRVTARTHAAHMVGGDFYDVLRLSDDETAIVAADVSGKGIAASLIMASCKAMIPFLAGSGGAAEVIHALNAHLCEQLQRREFVAMVLVRFDSRSGRAEIVNAGMPDPLVIGDGGGVEAVTCDGDRLPLGAMRGARYQSTTITLAHGERLLLFSDGLPEATVDGSPIGYERVEELAARATTVDAIVTEMRAIPGVNIDDDLTVVSLERI